MNSSKSVHGSTSNDKSKSIQEKITEVQDEYYSTNTKNMIFKNKQKMDCANQVSQNIDIKELFRHTLYILPNTPFVYFDYTIFKTYMSETNFELFLDYIDAEISPWVCSFSFYEVHLNMQSLTISGFERFRFFFDKLFSRLPDATKTLKNIYIYYTPSIVDHVQMVLRPFISEFINKTVFYSKAESPEKLRTFMLNFSS